MHLVDTNAFRDCVVRETGENSEASAAGVLKGDVVTDIDGTEVACIADVQGVLAEVLQGGGREIRVQVRRYEVDQNTRDELLGVLFEGVVPGLSEEEVRNGEGRKTRAGREERTALGANIYGTWPKVMNSFSFTTPYTHRSYLRDMAQRHEQLFLCDSLCSPISLSRH